MKVGLHRVGRVQALVVLAGSRFPDARHLATGQPTYSEVNFRDYAKRIKNAGAKPTIARICVA